MKRAKRAWREHVYHTTQAVRDRPGHHSRSTIPLFLRPARRSVRCHDDLPIDKYPAFTDHTDAGPLITAIELTAAIVLALRARTARRSTAAQSRKIELRRPALEAADAIGQHPVASWHDDKTTLQRCDIEHVQFPAIDDHACMAFRGIPPKRTAEPEPRMDLAFTWSALAPPDTGDVVVPIPARLDRNSILPLERSTCRLLQWDTID